MTTVPSDLAFPVFDSTGRYNPGSCGLTKREYFAGLAMQGILSHDSWHRMSDVAIAAVNAADALIDALNQGQE